MRKLTCALAVLAVGVAASAGTATTEKPRVIAHVAPVFPDVAIRQRIEGHVVIRYNVKADGMVGDAEVIESEPPGVFDDSALAAVSGFEFEPVTVDGEPVLVEGLSQRISFRITNRP